MKQVRVIIPAYNEEASIGKVIQDLPESVAEVIVVSNASTDQTEAIAKQNGATVLMEPIRGYGQACLTGIAYALSQTTDILAFIDGDYSDYPEELDLLLAKMENEDLDLVLGSRNMGGAQKGSLTPQQIFGNALATWLIRIIYGFTFTDLGPFRIIRTKAYQKLDMQDRNYGWTIEMQLKAVKHGLKIAEIPVTYRPRIGVSKVSGTLEGSIMAGYKIITSIFRYL